jgi:hypothetical protein
MMGSFLKKAKLQASPVVFAKKISDWTIAKAVGAVQETGWTKRQPAFKLQLVIPVSGNLKSLLQNSSYESKS